MLVLSAGMPRAGSGWYYNLTHDLLLAAGGQDARQIRRRFWLGRILTEVNCNIGALTPLRLLPVMLPSLLGNTFAVKAHAGPKPLALTLIRRGMIRPAYIYRDPRGAALSAFEYGQRGREKGRPNAFSHLTTLEDAIPFMLEYVRIWEAWMDCGQALHTRYEDLLSDYDAEAARLVAFLELDEEAIQAVVEQYRPGREDRGQAGLHFSHGQAERFRSALTAEQLEDCEQAFGEVLERMGYSR